ncbi:MAG: O-antigen ligase family protein [Candidatus Levybacteria bacterium]|nr:O-antigen ligase family protein [Candidatus Levybacteria bacterium]
MGLLKTFFIIFIFFLFPLGEIARYQFGNGISVTGIDIGTLLLIVVWLTVNIIRRKEKRILKSSLAKPIFLFIAACILSLVINIPNLKSWELFVSSLYLLRWVMYVGIYFIVSNFDNKFKKKVPALMVISGAIILALGYVQFFFYPNLRNLYYLGWDEHSYRMFSIFLDPNFAGTFFVLLLFLVFGLAVYCIKNKRLIYALALSLLASLTAIGIFLTYSRSAFIMFFVGTFTFLVLINRKRIIVPILAIFIVVFIISSKNFNIENTNLLRISSSKARLYVADKALTIIRDHPLFGVGFNAYRYAQIKYGFTGRKELILSHANAGTDNSFLFVLATTGLIGFAAYIYLWYKISNNLYILFKQNIGLNKIIPLVLLSSHIGISLASLFINALFYPFIMVWMWTLMGYCEKTKDYS